MSNATGSSSSTRNARNGRERVRVIGVPKFCSCGEPILTYTSSSDLNLNRRFFRCRYAASNMLEGHTFKWVDEAILDEFEIQSLRIKGLEDDVKELKMRRVDRVDEDFTMAIYEAEWRMKKWIVVVVVCFVITFAIFKIVG